MVRAAIYCRCSTEEESQQNALIQQVQESRKSVKEQGWLLTEEYIEAKSGTSARGRSEYNRLFGDLLEDKFDVVQIKTQDRLMRNTRDWYLFIDRLVTSGKKLYMYLEGKFYTPDDALITGIKAILAEEYSKELSKKMNNAHYHRQRDGRSFILPPNTYGLQKTKDGRVVLDEQEAEVIREIFALGRTMGCRLISRRLAEEGITSRSGAPFTDHMIRHIIRNPIRCGTVVQNRKHFDFQQKTCVKMPKEEWIVHRGAVPAAVSEEEWRETNACMTRRACGSARRAASAAIKAPADGQDAAREGVRNVNAMRKCAQDAEAMQECARGVDAMRESVRDAETARAYARPGRYRLSGRIRCGLCGSVYYRARRRRGKDGQAVAEWKCSRYLQEGRRNPDMRRDMPRIADRHAHAGCDNVHLDEGRLNNLLEKACRKYFGDFQADDPHIRNRAITILKDVLRQNDAGSQARQIRAELEKQERQGKKLLDKLLAEVISDEDYRMKKGEMERRRKALTEKLNALQTAENARLAAGRRLTAIRERLEKDIIREAVIAEKMDHIDSITVYPKKIVLSFQEDKPLGVCEPEPLGLDAGVTEPLGLDTGEMEPPGLSAGAMEPLELSVGVMEPLETASAHMQSDFEFAVPLGEDFFYAGRKTARKKRILSYIKENPQTTAKEIAQKEGMSLSGVNSSIARMEKKGILHFEGAGGHGFWVIDRELDGT